MDKPSDGKEWSLWPLALLGTLFFALFSSRRNQPDESPHPQDNTTETSGHGKGATPAVSELVPSVPEHPKTKTTCRPDQTPWWKTLGEGVALFGGLGLLIVNIYQMSATRDAAQAAKSAADTAQKQLEMSERPWLILQGITVDPPGFIFPKEGGAQISIRPQIKNIGHSVATGVIFSVKLFNPSRTSFFTEPLTKQQDLCKPIADKPIINSQWGRGVGDLVIFPSDIEQSWFYGLNLTQSEMDSTKLTVKIGDRDIGLLAPFIVGCVDYQYPTSTRHHQTQFIYRLERVNHAAKPGAIPTIAIRIGEPVSAPDVVIIKFPFGGFNAF
jgi:hypothetical protein